MQLGQAAASLGDEELAYRCLTQLINRFWLNNLASMHNHRSLFNMDISGGMPSVIIKMLVASDPGGLQLLPALPKAWPTGTIEGVLCRGQIEIKRLHLGRPDRAASSERQGPGRVLSRPPRSRPSDLKGRPAAALNDPRGRRLSLPAGRDGRTSAERRLTCAAARRGERRSPADLVLALAATAGRRRPSPLERGRSAVPEPATASLVDRTPTPPTNGRTPCPSATAASGAMVFGKTDEEEIQLNEDTYWSGGPYSTTVEGGYKALPEIRQLDLRRRAHAGPHGCSAAT
ncbi:MAG: glycoside hydrolase N-terminal domain-containing protein [Candidatus Moduliflexus flocculans]|nr:glycoside hydrolase N-terminal domain-containing protein [Candidatus Moduliflexus flocculans]